MEPPTQRSASTVSAAITALRPRPRVAHTPHAQTTPRLLGATPLHTRRVRARMQNPESTVDCTVELYGVRASSLSARSLSLSRIQDAPGDTRRVAQISIRPPAQPQSAAQPGAHARAPGRDNARGFCKEETSDEAGLPQSQPVVVPASFRVRLRVRGPTGAHAGPRVCVNEPAARAHALEGRCPWEATGHRACYRGTPPDAIHSARARARSAEGMD